MYQINKQVVESEFPWNYFWCNDEQVFNYSRDELSNETCLFISFDLFSLSFWKASAGLAQASTDMYPENSHPPRFCSIWWWKCNFNLLFIDDISSHIIALFCDIANLSRPYSTRRILFGSQTDVGGKKVPMNLAKLHIITFFKAVQKAVGTENSIIYFKCFGISSRIDEIPW